MRLSVLLLAAALAACASDKSASAKCSDYGSWREAQAALESGQTRLDGDGDGIACESLPGAPSSSGAPKGPRSYDRAAFGSGWDDADGDCQDMRAEVLAELSTARVVWDGCRVARGRWIDPYTGRTFLDASDLDVDHVVPLAWAWEHGADTWTAARREDFANDPVNLQPTDAGTNRAKGADGPDQWLPPNVGYRCEYVLRFTRISRSYGLLDHPSDRAAIDRVRAQVCG